jgi:hypothetical protein
MKAGMHSLFVALGQSALGRYMQTSVWGFAVVEAIHLLAIALLGGSVLIIDLRLLGVILRKEPARVLSRDLGRLLLGSLAILILTGIAMVSEEALKCYYSPAFRWKMALLGSSVFFYFTLHRRALIQTDQNAPTIWSRITAIMSMSLWLGVGVAGRAIGFL